MTSARLSVRLGAAPFRVVARVWRARRSGRAARRRGVPQERERPRASPVFRYDWLGSGIKKAGDVVLGPLELGVKEIAGLLAAIVGALADLLVPKSLVNAGLDGIKWLVQLPPVGADATPQPGAPDVRTPHLQELRDTMTWIGITVLDRAVTPAHRRAFLVPTADLLYDWAWGVVATALPTFSFAR